MAAFASLGQSRAVILHAHSAQFGFQVCAGLGNLLTARYCTRVATASRESLFLLHFDLTFLLDQVPPIIGAINLQNSSIV